MGNAPSTGNENKVKTLPEVIDYVATNLIMTQNFRDMKNLADQQYCDKLVILTSDVIGQKLNTNEIRFLAQRIKEGVVVNKMTKDKIIYFDRDDITKLDVSNSTNKRRMCIGIAKFYVKIAHLFSAIMTTINPTYKFRNASGDIDTVSIMKKGAIPEGVDRKLERNSLCSSRINALLNGQSFTSKQDDDNITINPNFCNMNANNAGTKTLSQEPGIPELKFLYFDVYDYDTGGFKSMSPEMQKKYEEDVKLFYKEYTGHSTVPDNIKNFSDIKLREYHKSKGCERGGIYTKGYTGTLKQQLFQKYAEHVSKMVERTNASQDKLLAIIDELFVFSFDKVEKTKRIIINPSLTESKLQTLVDQTRQIIVNLYLTCERDFVTGLEIFEAIVEKQILDSSKAQLTALEKSLDLNIGNQGQAIPEPKIVMPPMPPTVQEEKPDTEQVVPTEPITPKPETEAETKPEAEPIQRPETEQVRPSNEGKTSIVESVKDIQQRTEEAVMPTVKKIEQTLSF